MFYLYFMDRKSYEEIKKPASIFLAVLLLWVFLNVFYLHPTAVSKGDVYKIEETGDTVKMYFRFSAGKDEIESVHIALKDTLNLKLNTVGEYDVIYKTFNPNSERCTLVVKK